MRKIYHIPGRPPLYCNSFLIITQAGNGIIIDPDAPAEEYNRLLMTNLILVPIHPIAGCSVYVQGKKEYTDRLKQNSAGLYKMVFHLPYLEYIEWIEPSGLQQKADVLQQKANPARIEVLCDGYPLKELNAKSIAEYKEVTPANVTYYSKRFAKYLEEIAEQDLAITD